MEDSFIKTYNDTRENISTIVLKKVQFYATNKYSETDKSILIQMINILYSNSMMKIDPESESYDKDYYSSIDILLKDDFKCSIWKELDKKENKKISYTKVKSNSIEICFKCKEPNASFYD